MNSAHPTAALARTGVRLPSPRRRVSAWLAAWALLLFPVHSLISATLPPGVTLYGATFGGGTFVSVGANGVIYSSVSGGPWTPRTSGTTNRLEAVAFGGGLFMAAGEDGTLVSSPDGVTWTERSIVVTQKTPQIAYGNGRFVVGGKGGVGLWTMLISSNGADWLSVSVEAPGPTNAPAGLPFGGISFGAGKFVAIGGAPYGASLFLNSTNGTTWTQQGASGASPSSFSYGPMIFGNGVFAALEYFYDADDDDDGFYERPLFSEDGASWRPIFQYNVNWKAIAAGDCTFLLAADNPAGTLGSFRATSRNVDGQWTILTVPTIDIVNALAYGNGKFFAFGSDILEVPVPPVSSLIPINPSNSVTPIGYYIYLTAGSSCLSPPVYYQWRRNGVNIPGATNTYMYFQALSTNDSGQYTVVVTNALGQTETSQAAIVSVTPPAFAPAKVEYPASPTSHSSPSAIDYFPSASVSGWPQPTYQWRFNGVDLPGATNIYLSLINLTPAAQGLYTIVASNVYGSDTSAPIHLFVSDYAPNYSSLQLASTAREGSRFTFFAPHYFFFYNYWLAGAQLYVFKDGLSRRLPLTVDLDVALNSVALSDAGRYDFAVSNALGMSTAVVYTVTVTPAGPLEKWTQRNPLPHNENLFDSAFGNGTYVAVAPRGAIAYSSNSVDWAATRTRGEAALGGVAFGNGVFVAVGGPNIFTSVNGRNWSLQLARFDVVLQTVFFANGRFFAAGGDSMLTSINGRDWTSVNTSFANNRNFRDIAFGNGTYLAVGDGRLFAGAWSSTDATNWSRVAQTPPEELEAIAFGAGQFVAVGDDGIIYTTPDGGIWTERDSTYSTRLLGVAYGAGRFVAVGSRGRIVSSANGSSWTRETSGTPDRLESVRFLNGLFVAVGENGTILTSPNGSTWTKRSRGVTRDLDGLAQGAGLLVIAGKGGTILTSTNGRDYTQQNTGTTNDLHGVGYGNGLFAAVGEPEIIITSSNGINWQTRHTGNLSSLKNVRRGNNGWVAVGTEGVILTSPDGVTWTPRNSSTFNDLNDVVYGAGTYVIVGDSEPPNGTMLVSTDGVTWKRRPQFIGKNLRSVNFMNDMFVATANDEVILYSTNAAQWSVYDGFLYFGPEQNLRGSHYAAGRWVIAGNAGLVMSSSNMVNWARHFTPTIENLHGVEFLNDRFVVIGNRGTIFQSESFAPQPTLFGRNTGAGFEIIVMGRPGTEYEVQAANAFPSIQWSPVGTVRLEGTVTNLLDPRSLTNAQRFYRAVIP